MSKLMADIPMMLLYFGPLFLYFTTKFSFFKWQTSYVRHIIYANVQGNILMRLQIPSRNIIQSKPKIMLCSAQFELKPN